MNNQKLASDYILDILKKHVGVENKIESVELLRQINHSFGGRRRPISNRTMRILIERLRRTDAGDWIAASLKKGGGYFTAASYSELEEYCQPDINRATTMLSGRNDQKKRALRSIAPRPLQIEMNFRYRSPRTHIPKGPKL